MATLRPSATLLSARIARQLEELRHLPPRNAPLEWLPQALPAAFTLGFGPHHAWLSTRLSPDGARGVRAVVGAPRGSGKSTFTTVGLPVIALARRSHSFVVITRTRADDAVRSVDIIEEHCGRLAERYPWLLPTRRVEGELYLASGAIVVPRGTGSAVRGLQRRRGRRIMRPDLFIGDDLETDASARSSLMVGRLEDWVHATVGQLGGPPGKSDTTPLDILIAGTTLHPSSMLTRALDREERWRNWAVGRFPAEGKVGQDGLVYDTQQRAVPIPAGAAAPGERVALWPDGQPLSALDRLTDPESDGFIGSLVYAQEYLLDPRSTTDVLFPKHLTRWERPKIGHDPASASHVLIRSGVGVDAAASESDASDYSSVCRVSLLLRHGSSARRPIHDLYIGPEVDRRRLSLTGLTDWAERVSLDNGTAPVAYETNGGFKWGAQELRKRRSVPVRDVAASTDKRTRAVPLTLWHEARRVILDPALQGGPFDTEFHSFTGAGDVHDDQVDAGVWAAYLVTNNWRL
jgi:hypothetical protein